MMAFNGDAYKGRKGAFFCVFKRLGKQKGTAMSTEETKKTLEEAAAQEGQEAVPAPDAEGKQDGGEAKNTRRKAIAVLAAAAVLVAACIAGIVALTTPPDAPEPEPAPMPPAEEKEQSYSLAVRLEAEGWTEAATKATVRIESDAEGAAGPVEREVACNEDVELVALATSSTAQPIP